MHIFTAPPLEGRERHGKDMHELLSRIAIQKTLAIYASAVDRGNMPELLSAFTDHAVFRPLSDYPACFGHGDISQFFTDFGDLARSLPGIDPKSFQLNHHLTTSKIDFETSTTAKGFTRFMVMSPFGLDHSGYYTDIFETLDNADWQLSHRQITLDWKAPASPLNALFKKISETNNTYGQRLANPAINTTYSESECPASKLTLLTIPSIVP